MGPSAQAVLLTSSSRCGSGSPCSSGRPSPSATGWTLIRYSSIRPWAASERAKLAPPKTTMSLPGWPLSSGISSSAGRSLTRALLHSTWGERAGEHDFRQRVHELAGRALRARPRLRHVLAAPAAEDEHAGLAEQFGYRALAMGAVRLLLAEPVHGPVAASGEAVQRHRHVEDELALGRLAAHASSFHPVRACEPSQNGFSAERPQRHR
jgi:hypothetical protein